MPTENRYELNKNLAQMLKGGVIMDVTTPEQAKIAGYSQEDFEAIQKLYNEGDAFDKDKEIKF